MLNYDHQYSSDCSSCSRGSYISFANIHAPTLYYVAMIIRVSVMYEFSKHTLCSKLCDNLYNHGRKCGNKYDEPCTPCIENCQWNVNTKSVIKNVVKYVTAHVAMNHAQNYCNVCIPVLVFVVKNVHSCAEM